jgi:hypothetical protein
VDLDTLADELYALPPEEFTAARDAAVKRADDAELKKAVKALRKPTASAHAVNRIVREDPDAVDALLDLGDDLRAAMTGRGGDVRVLTEARRERIGRLVDAVLPANVREDVTATLEAATADPDLGAAVRSGRLVKPLRYAGFGAMPDLAEAVATAVPAGRTTKRKPAKKATPPKKAAPPRKDTEPKDDRDLLTLRQRVLELSGQADDAQRRYDEASRAAVEARKLLDRAEQERAAAHKAAREAHAAAEKARRELGRLERS